MQCIREANIDKVDAGRHIQKHNKRDVILPAQESIYQLQRDTAILPTDPLP